MYSFLSYKNIMKKILRYFASYQKDDIDITLKGWSLLYKKCSSKSKINLCTCCLLSFLKFVLKIVFKSKYSGDETKGLIFEPFIRCVLVWFLFFVCAKKKLFFIYFNHFLLSKTINSAGENRRKPLTF